jgi:uncharacterized protein YcbK (DUF882 family)
MTEEVLSMSNQRIFRVRRSLLRLSGSLVFAAASAPAIAKLTMPVKAIGRDAYMAHLHTAEKIDVVYAVDNQYVDPVLAKLNHFLRDHYSHEVGVMDPRLYDLMHQIRRDLGARGAFDVISGYRSPSTNERLRVTGGGGVAKRSLHMDGKAIDLRLPGVPLSELRDAAIAQQQGGVGYYPRDQFVHIDTGKVRFW